MQRLHEHVPSAPDSFRRLGFRRPSPLLLKTVLLGATLLALGSLIAACPASAQGLPDSSAVRMNSFEVWSGGTLGTGRLFGRAYGVRLGELALRYARVLSVRERTVLRYTADLAAIWLRYSGYEVYYRSELGPRQKSGLLRGMLRVDGDARAVGATPLGLQQTFWSGRRVQLFLSGSLGVLYFGERVPEEYGRQLNFKIGVGFGVEVAVTEALSLRLGYRYSHISNAFRGEINPGFEASMLRLGVTMHH